MSFTGIRKIVGRKVAPGFDAQQRQIDKLRAAAAAGVPGALRLYERALGMIIDRTIPRGQPGPLTADRDRTVIASAAKGAGAEVVYRTEAKAVVADIFAIIDGKSP